MLLQAADAEYAGADQDETDPGYPKNKAAKQFAGGGQRGLAKKLRCSGVLGELVKPRQSQDSAQN